MLSAWPTKSTCSNSISWIPFKSSIVLTGSSIIGPFVSSISKGMPMAFRGVRISLNKISPSGLNECQGCRVISTIRSVVSDLCLNPGYFCERSLYAFWYLPAWRIIQAGGLSTGKPSAALTKRGRFSLSPPSAPPLSVPISSLVDARNLFETWWRVLSFFCCSSESANALPLPLPLPRIPIRERSILAPWLSLSLSASPPSKRKERKTLL
mmetsp:Transcript_15150/g.29308  ORF Transcript_15150/g.29308 Transcript_15150/m.29308 type:complete len:210 (-) Transcript_15150:169-798(-)